MSAARRAMVSELVIVSALCAGVQLAFVEPTRQGAREAEGALDVAFGAIESSVAPAVSADLTARAELADRFESISAPLRDRTVLFACISRMAAKRELTLDRLDSVAGSARGVSPSGPGPVSTYSLEAVGDFADVTRFIRDLEHELVLVRLYDIRLLPANPEQPGSTSLRLRFSVLDAGALASVPEPAEARP